MSEQLAFDVLDYGRIKQADLAQLRLMIRELEAAQASTSKAMPAQGRSGTVAVTWADLVKSDEIVSRTLAVCDRIVAISGDSEGEQQ